MRSKIDAVLHKILTVSGNILQSSCPIEGLYWIQTGCYSWNMNRFIFSKTLNNKYSKCQTKDQIKLRNFYWSGCKWQSPSVGKEYDSNNISSILALFSILMAVNDKAHPYAMYNSNDISLKLLIHHCNRSSDPESSCSKEKEILRLHLSSVRCEIFQPVRLEVEDITG